MNKKRGDNDDRREQRISLSLAFQLIVVKLDHDSRNPRPAQQAEAEAEAATAAILESAKATARKFANQPGSWRAFLLRGVCTISVSGSNCDGQIGRRERKGGIGVDDDGQQREIAAS